MPKTTVWLKDIPQPNMGLPCGSAAGDSVAEQLDHSLDPGRASDFDPLKVVVSFDSVEDVGAAVLDRLVRKIRDVYSQNYSWYVSFTGLGEETPLYSVLSSLLKILRVSIVCEPNARLFCGVTEQDMTARTGPYRVSDWRSMAIVIDSLHNQGEDRFLPMQALVDQLGAAGYGRTKARQVVRTLDDRGII